jgi:hypothetical protein
MGMKKERVVKVDGELLKRVEVFLKNESNRLRYSSMKQFVDIAILEMLDNLENKDGSKRRGK